MTNEETLYLARTIEGQALLGDDGGFVPLESATPGVRSVEEALPLAAAGELPSVDEATSERIPTSSLTFGVPLVQFGTILGIGLNYVDHAADLDETAPKEPASFVKPSTIVTGPAGRVRLPAPTMAKRITGEAEIGVVIGRSCRGIGVENVDSVIAGYVPIIDMTAEDVLQRNPRFLTRAKAFETFLVAGPWIAIPPTNTALATTTVETRRNGEVTASNTVENMTFSPRDLVSFHSDVYTLRPGDLVSTGTPGAAVIKDGDEIGASIEEIGDMSVPVVGNTDAG